MMYNDFNIGKYDAKIAPIKYGRTSFYSLDRYDVFRGQFPVNVLLNDLTIIKPKK